jgi:large subunit ribosomal protein L2
MGRRIVSRKRGSGGHRYTAPSHRYKSNARYRNDVDGSMRGVITEFVDDPSRTGVLMVVKFEDGVETTYLAPEGVYVGQEIWQGKGVNVQIGNVLPLGGIPEGTPIFNLEGVPKDGGEVIRGSGSAGYIVSKERGKATVRMPSGGTKRLDTNCRATVGVSAGGGRLEKPFVKAGRKMKKERARGHWYPRVRGVAMNAINHPHGGSQHHAGKSTTVSKNAPPGRKVGHVGARRTGRRKK